MSFGYIGHRRIGCQEKIVGTVGVMLNKISEFSICSELAEILVTTYQSMISNNTPNNDRGWMKAN